jgi:hypothetical protein
MVSSYDTKTPFYSYDGCVCNTKSSDRKIVQRLRKIFLGENLDRNATLKPEVPFKEKIDGWFVDTDYDPIPEQKIEEYSSLEDMSDINYDVLISTSSAYEWLLSRVRNILTLALADPDHMGRIRRCILRALPTDYRISAKTPPKALTATFELDWDPIAFFDEQEYTEQNWHAIGAAITLTGSLGSAQAMTCAEYLRQTWPSSGEHLLHLMERVIRNSPNQQAHSKPQLFSRLSS